MELYSVYIVFCLASFTHQYVFEIHLLKLLFIRQFKW